MIHARLQNLNFDIPERVEEITIGQFIALRNKDIPSIHLLGILGNIPEAMLLTIRYKEAEINQALSLLGSLTDSINDYFSEENGAERMKTPKFVVIADKTIKVPEDLISSAYWATRKGTMLIQEEEKSLDEGTGLDLTSKYPELIAHYLYCPYTEMKYNEDRADEFVQIVNDLPLTVAIPLGNFIMLDLGVSSKQSIRHLAWRLTKQSAALTMEALSNLARWLRLTT